MAAMRISLHRHGGFAAIPGLELRVDVDTANLPKAEAEQLESAVHNAGIDDLSASPSKPQAGDRRIYDLTVHDGSRTQSASLTEPIQIPAVRDLINLLVSRSGSAH